MEDRSAASVGVVLAGLALAAAALPWGTAGVGPVENVVVALFAGAALGAFALRRRGLLDAAPGSFAAGVASLAVVGYVVVGTSGVLDPGGVAGPTSPSPWGVGLALVGGLGGVVAAYGDVREFPATFRRRVLAVGRSLGIGVSGLFATVVWGSVLVSLIAAVVPGDPGRMYRYASSTLGLGLGSGTVAAAYFLATDRSLSFLDVRLPTRWDLGYAVAGIVLLLVVMQAVTVVFSALGMSVADHSVEQVAAGNPEILLMLIPAAWLVIGPGEELIYRNIIQKSLYDSFSEWGAVAVASVVFALVHIPTYAAGASSALAVLNTLVVIFLLSMILGGTYLRTGNLVVPVLIHGTYDVLSFLSIYFQVTGGGPAFLVP